MNNPDQRQRHILKQIEERGSVNVLELAETLEVSDMTIRRDLNELERMGLLQRIHGGAISSRGRGYEPPLAVRSIENLAEKQLIGKYAAAMVAEGDSIALDVGSSIYQIAVNLAETRNITIITPSLPIANLFSNRSDVRLILPGGVVRTGETSMIGELARRNLEQLFVDRLFLGVGALDSKSGLTEYNLDDAAVKQVMIRNAKEVILIADASKFQKVAFAFVAPFVVVNQLITNEEPPRELLTVLKHHNITVHVVNNGASRVI